VTYRVGAHSTADDVTRYRDDDDLERWQRLDPISRFRRYLVASGTADEAFAGACEREAEERVRAIRAALIATPDPPPRQLFEWVYEDPPASLSRQRAEGLGEG
jgi:pyruvate dehydrogenase E1 component alpha subunit